MTIRGVVDARKERIGSGELAPVFEGVKRLIVLRGKAVKEINITETPPDSAEFERAVLGPSGNLRAPTLRSASTAIVGFNADVFADVLG